MKKNIIFYLLFILLTSCASNIKYVKEKHYKIDHIYIYSNYDPLDVSYQMQHFLNEKNYKATAINELKDIIPFKSSIFEAMPKNDFKLLDEEKGVVDLENVEEPEWKKLTAEINETYIEESEDLPVLESDEAYLPQDNEFYIEYTYAYHHDKGKPDYSVYDSEPKGGLVTALMDLASGPPRPSYRIGRIRANMYDISNGALVSQYNYRNDYGEQISKAAQVTVENLLSNINETLGYEYEEHDVAIEEMSAAGTFFFCLLVIFLVWVEIMTTSSD